MIPNIDSLELLQYDNIKSQHIKELFRKAFFSGKKAEIPNSKLKKMGDVL